jgi:hypothetical protein
MRAEIENLKIIFLYKNVFLRCPNIETNQIIYWVKVEMDLKSGGKLW